MINGAIASLVTPFRSNEDMDLDALRAFSSRVAGAGFDVVCFAGGTGEFLSLNVAEREAGLKAVIDGAQGKPVLATALLTSQKQILDVAEDYAKIGASAIMVMPPYFYAMDQKSMFAHFLKIGQESALPVLLFNSQGRGGKTMSNATILRLAEACPNIIGVKETTENMSDIGALVNGTPGDFCVIQSHEPVLLPSYAVGAAGSFGSLCNLMPKTVVALHRAIDSNHNSEARRLTKVLTEVGDVVYSVTIPVGIKYLMNKLGIHQGSVRSPLSMLSLNDEIEEQLNVIAIKVAETEEAI
ncbi:dihydrodipicolinate synthase family protein [Brucella intermedia GD04153]|uniref:Dihydrodipicolinate synthase family protein n=1 Tax=Brucella intermedia GD04153 TaxID=2975438 RepID=A0AA42H1I4_9HYPH|nr:dihydrodipicolinate synthase family protein [Brucella intermedia]MDH0126948.1 dihydrodipicolinate synthase family protein [Brucella intermedia GD04153]RRD22349.1 dihydrodipicolinate synthase family protein [Brucellaceae bacterium VT-16-1752]